MSSTGVPSTASRFATPTRVPLIAVTVVGCSPIGFGRSCERVQKTPAILAFFASFYAVSCRSAAACTAVGNIGGSGASVTLAEDWTGKQWAIQRTVSSPNGSTLAGVSCPPSGPCIAVGSQGNNAGVSVTLAEAGPG